MNLSQFLLILRARSKIILIALVLTVSTTLVFSLLMPKTYQATASVLLNSKGVDPVSGLTMPGQLMPGYMATQIDIITSKNLALRVVDRLKLAQSAAVVNQFNAATGGRGTVRDWLADLLLRKIEAVPARESSLIEISFKGADPQFVAEVANAFAEEYQRLNIQLKVEPMKKVSIYLNEQLKNSRDALEAAQSHLSKYQQEHGLVSVDNRLDVESSRLNDLSAQLVGAEGQLMEATSRQHMANGAAGDSPDVAGNQMIQNLRLTLANAEAKLAEVGQRLERNHPQYLSAKAEVDKMRAELAVQTKNVSTTVGNNAQILRQRSDEVRAALRAQKDKVLELNRTRDEMGVLIKDVESAQHSYDAIAQRASQTRLEGQAEQTDIAILNPATAPLEAAGPKILLNTMLALFLGSILGVALGMVLELIDRRVRSETDLSEALSIPVFAVISWTSPKKRRFDLKKIFSPSRLRLN